MFRLLLLGVFVMLLMDKGDRVLTLRGIKHCNLCEHFDGSKCHAGMGSCWKFDMLLKNKSCTTENYYFNNRLTGVYLFRYSKLSCKPCAEGMQQIFHDLLKETFCCTDKSYCNDGSASADISPLLLEYQKPQKELND